jgi:hypothetical protein
LHLTDYEFVVFFFKRTVVLAFDAKDLGTVALLVYLGATANLAANGLLEVLGEWLLHVLHSVRENGVVLLGMRDLLLAGLLKELRSLQVVFFFLGNLFHGLPTNAWDIIADQCSVGVESAFASVSLLRGL